MVSSPKRRARVSDIHHIAKAMPHTTVLPGTRGRPVYQVGGRSFVYFRNPRPDALGDAGERLTDVVVIWVPNEADKQALLQDKTSPFFTTAHFDGHPSVLLREADVAQLSLAELTEVIQDAWLSRASNKRRRDWLASQGLPTD